MDKQSLLAYVPLIFSEICECFKELKIQAFKKIKLQTNIYYIIYTFINSKIKFAIFYIQLEDYTTMCISHFNCCSIQKVSKLLPFSKNTIYIYRIDKQTAVTVYIKLLLLLFFLLVMFSFPWNDTIQQSWKDSHRIKSTTIKKYF